MATTEFGKAVRKARIDADVSLSSMAIELGTTAAFLSAMETGRKKVPAEWIKKIGGYFEARGVIVRNLAELADVSNQSVSLEGLSPAQQMMVAGFARRNFDDSQLQHFKELLGLKE